jgi:hypothetical protein
MKRALTTALVATMALLPGLAFSADAPKAEKEEPAVTEPEQSGAEVAPDKKGPDGKGTEQVYESYTVKPGDTLWDLSSRYLGNPWYWPKVWSYNPEIENPHWIYPGNTIRFYPGGEEMPAQVEAGMTPPEEMGEVTKGSMDAPDLMGEDEDIVAIAAGTKMGYHPGNKGALRQDGLVTQRELDESGVIDKSYGETEMLDRYDKVYLVFRNRSAVRIGERYSIFRTQGKVTHPDTGSNFGYMTHIIGTLRIIAVDQKAVTGVIEHVIEPVERGDYIGPLGNFNKQVILKDATRDIKGVILVSMMEALPFLGEHHWVFIDKGSRDGVEEGNSFVVVHRGDPLLGEDSAKRYPDEKAGVVLILDVKENTSAGLVVRSLRELSVGDRVVSRTASRASLP